ncbi:hypothetical protein ACSBR2_000532 [Camellia fascicularis]
MWVQVTLIHIEHNLDLIYDTPPQDYEYVVIHELHKEVNFHHHEVTSNNSVTTIQTFQRTLTSVGDSVATYNAEVIAP